MYSPLITVNRIWSVYLSNIRNLQMSVNEMTGCCDTGTPNAAVEIRQPIIMYFNTAMCVRVSECEHLTIR